MLDASQAEVSKVKSEAEATKKSAAEFWDRFSSSTSRFLFFDKASYQRMWNALFCLFGSDWTQLTPPQNHIKEFKVISNVHACFILQLAEKVKNLESQVCTPLL